MFNNVMRLNLIGYHMVTAERLHDRGLIQELDPLPETGCLVNRLHGNARLSLALNHIMGHALVHHPERALTQLTQQGDLLPRHLPLIRLVHYTHTFTVL